MGGGGGRGRRRLLELRGLRRGDGLGGGHGVERSGVRGEGEGEGKGENLDGTTREGEISLRFGLLRDGGKWEDIRWKDR